MNVDLNNVEESVYTLYTTIFFYNVSKDMN